ncbi:Tad domain-containing protein [Actinoplanes sp. NPDC051475]|uniref:Tad domain-containing protein n=1 Tax=Actinoplanes sp. NPDC051475 TaxID=3157225 RepID=UPI00344EA86A
MPTRRAHKRTEPSTGKPSTGDEGQISLFTVLITAALMLVTGLVLDAGLALSSKTQALDVAQSAARAGAQHLDIAAYRADGTVRLNRADAEGAARRWLASAGMTGQVTATATEVSVTARTSRRTQLLSLIGVSSLSVSASATATAQHGVTTPDR